MGWTFYHAVFYNKGKIDRKSECDNLFNENFRIEKSSMVGSTYYAAITAIKEYSKDRKTLIEIPKDRQKTFAVVILTHTRSNDYYNFGYKEIDETMGPSYYDCPASILKLLSETESMFALEWRRRCREKINQKKNNRKNPNSLSNLPIGAIIELEDGTKLEKVAPSHQFRRPFWKYVYKNYYMPTTHIKEYKVISY